MYEKSPDTVSLELGVSHAFAAVLAFAHAGAAVIALLVPMPLLVRIGLLVFAGISFKRALCVHALRRAPAAVVAFSLNDDGACALRRRGADAWQEGRLRDCWVHPWLTILIVRGEDRRVGTSIVIPADAVSAEGFRRLRVRLRLGTAAA